MTDAPTTVPGALLARAGANPAAVAYAVEDHGIWREVTYERLLAEVGRAAAALRGAGLGAGDRIVLMGDPSPRFLVVDLAAQLLGVLPVALYPSLDAEEVERLLALVDAPLFVAGSQEYVDLVLEAGGPASPRVVVMDDRGMFDYGPDVVTRFDAWLDGASALPADELAALAAGLDPDAPAFVFFTAGTTGPAEPVPLSQRNVVSAWTSVFAVLGEPTPADRILVDLPLAHLAGRAVSAFVPILYGCVPHYAGSVESIATARTQVVPTIAVGTPRSWGRVGAQVTVGIETTSRLKRAVFRTALAARRRSVAGAGWARPVAALLHHVAVRPALEELGCSGLRLALVVGARTPARVVEDWRLLGVELCEVYGSVETSGAATVQPPGSPAGAPGRALPGTEVIVDTDGEILVRGPHVGTAAAGEWYRTGDLGTSLAPGQLVVVDRRADLVARPGGAVLHPAELEQELVASTYVAEAVVVELGARLAALVELEFEAVAEWARSQRVAYTSLANLAAQPEVATLVEGELRAANERLERAGLPRLDAVRILPRDLDPGAGELTPTRTVRRATVVARYAPLFQEEPAR